MEENAGSARMSDKFNHSICRECWNKKNPGHRAHALEGADIDICCYCGEEHDSGIYVRDVAVLECNGDHSHREE